MTGSKQDPRTSSTNESSCRETLEILITEISAQAEQRTFKILPASPFRGGGLFFGTADTFAGRDKRSTFCGELCCSSRHVLRPFLRILP